MYYVVSNILNTTEHYTFVVCNKSTRERQKETAQILTGPLHSSIISKIGLIKPDMEQREHSTKFIITVVNLTRVILNTEQTEACHDNFKYIQNNSTKNFEPKFQIAKSTPSPSSLFIGI